MCLTEWGRVVTEVQKELTRTFKTIQCSSIQLLLVPFSSVQLLSRGQLFVTPWTACSMPGFPVCHQLPELTQTHVHPVGDAIQPSHPLSSPSLPAFNLSQHRSFPMSQFFASGGQSIRVSASASVLPLTYVSSLNIPLCLGLPRWRWRRQWHPTPVLLPGKSHGRRSLVGCSPWGGEESDTTERLHFHFSLSCIGEGNGNPLQSSCLENPRDRGAWWAAAYGVAQSRTRLKRLSSSSRWR